MIWTILEHFSNLMTTAAAGVWREAFAMLPAWMKAIAVFLLVLTFGMSLMECWWGYKMNRGARFFAGFGSGVNIAFLTAALTAGTEDRKVLIWVLIAGAACGIVYCLLPRLYLTAGGVILGCTAAAAAGRFIPALVQGSRNGRILLAVLALTGGILAGAFAVKLGGAVHGLIGGALLGTILAGLIPLDRITFLSNIPWMNQRLLRMILFGVCAGTGVLAQSLSLHAVRKREKMFGGSSDPAREDRPEDVSEARESGSAAEEGGRSSDKRQDESGRAGVQTGAYGTAGARTENSGSYSQTGAYGTAGARTGAFGYTAAQGTAAGRAVQGTAAGHASQGGTAQDSSGLDAFTRYELKNLEDMEADISGKAGEIARELTETVARAVASARLQDRCADVAEGLYSPEIAAEKLGMPEQMFLEAMQQKGLRLPAETETARREREQTEDSADGGTDRAVSDKAAGTESAQAAADDTQQRKD